MITTWRLLPCGCEILREGTVETVDRDCGWGHDLREQATDALLLGGLSMNALLGAFPDARSEHGSEPDPDEAYDALRDAEVGL